MTKITQAFIFAAGRGERMRPLTDSIPKPLVKIKDKAIIDYIIKKLDKIPDIEKIIINGFYLADQIKNHIKKLNNPKIIFSHEIEKIETGGGLIFAKNEIDLNKPLLTINGDVLWQEREGSCDIKTICDNWSIKDCNILLGLKKTAEYLGYNGDGDFNLQNGNLFKSSNLKMTHAFTGMQIIDPKILKNITKKCFSMSYFYKEAIGEDGLLQKIKGIELEGKYFHIGTVDAIKMTENNL